jgi:cystathionine gamma-synthase
MPEPCRPNGDFDTQSVHAGETRNKPYNALAMPIVQTSTYQFENTAVLLEHLQRKEQGLEPVHGEYGRAGNPTQETVEHKLAALDSAERALLLSSGMAAITCTFLALLSQGDHLILLDDCYRKTRQLSVEFLARFGISCTPVTYGDVAACEAAITPHTRLLLLEVPSNPYLRVPDLVAYARLARRKGVLTLVDTTLATPYNLRPLEYGLDLVTHSATKYLGGHNDLLAGVVAGRIELIKQIKDVNGMVGAIPDAQTSYLLLRGLKTLGLRMERHNANGQALAGFLEGHPAVRRVWYPGLPSHPDHSLARSLLRGSGGVVSFELDADEAGTTRFMDALQIPYLGPSLGGVESLVEQPALLSHFTSNEAERRALGIPNELVRYAAGVEDAADLIDDLAQALARV